ncbi:hypothetical protein NL676_020838 [Syzygium grande]|nr:hypothetical protein NL676_020838 [Syzygium grande]
MVARAARWSRTRIRSSTGTQYLHPKKSSSDGNGDFRLGWREERLLGRVLEGGRRDSLFLAGEGEEWKGWLRLVVVSEDAIYREREGRATALGIALFHPWDPPPPGKMARHVSTARRAEIFSRTKSACFCFVVRVKNKKG